MNRLVGQRYLLNAAQKNNLFGRGLVKFSSGKNEGPPPPCEEPPPLCLPTQQQPKPCPPPPPPCGPPCPPPICVADPDPNNPCNYVPPEDPDPDDPDMTRIKKWQCFFQRDEDVPMFLRRGRVDAVLFQTSAILTGLAFLQSLYYAFKITSM